MSEELNERRHVAMTELLEAAKEIAEAHNLCPVCLVMAVHNIVRSAVADGEIVHFTDRHAGDEPGKGLSLQ
jgi:hypothetical protein